MSNITKAKTTSITTAKSLIAIPTATTTITRTLNIPLKQRLMKYYAKEDLTRTRRGQNKTKVDVKKGEDIIICIFNQVSFGVNAVLENNETTSKHIEALGTNLQGYLNYYKEGNLTRKFERKYFEAKNLFDDISNQGRKLLYCPFSVVALIIIELYKIHDIQITPIEIHYHWE
ncbi:hypothetical protein CHS0354_002998 [Potamilus streckersoni]|uniref:Uncharacterized protein n=1 Tax=Potamilus streckersoni TaxID=2493646 RepID=A0AAE0VSR0_9BIVA|nr:hypothetical protein CHS0354_002998 [Potamilus streckersoni]